MTADDGLEAERLAREERLARRAQAEARAAEQAEAVQVSIEWTRPRRPWLTPLLVALASFALTALVIRAAVRRQTPILASMELQPVASAAAFAYAWGSREDAAALERRLLELAERSAANAPSFHAAGEPDFDLLRRMDADMAKLRLAVLADAPRAAFEALCTQATIRCNRYVLDGLIGMVQKQRHIGPNGAVTAPSASTSAAPAVGSSAPAALVSASASDARRAP